MTTMPVRPLRGRPPSDAAHLDPPVVVPLGPAPDDPLATLQALSREPAERAEATAEALRAELRVLHGQIIPGVLTELRRFRDQHATRLNALRTLNYSALRAALPSTSILAQELLTRVDQARLAFAPSPHPEGGGDVITQLERYAGQIDRLSSDADAAATLRAKILDAANFPAQFSRELAYVEDVALRIQTATRGSERAPLVPSRPDPTPAPPPAFDPFR